MRTHEESLMTQGEALARQCGNVLENQLGMVLAHLRRHQDPAATERLLENLLKSPFANRTQRTREQMADLHREVGRVLRRYTSWHDAAQIVGWAKRLHGAPR